MPESQEGKNIPEAPDIYEVGEIPTQYTPVIVDKELEQNLDVLQAIALILNNQKKILKLLQ